MSFRDSYYFLVLQPKAFRNEQIHFTKDYILSFTVKKLGYWCRILEIWLPLWSNDNWHFTCKIR